MPSKQQSHILTIYQTHVFAKLHKQIEHWLRLKKIIEALKKKVWSNASSFQVLGAIGNLSFGKACKCIHMSELYCQKSSLGESFHPIWGTNKLSNEWTESRTN